METKARSNRMSVAEAALEMGKCQMYVRMGLRAGRFPWGSAVLGGKGKIWSYFISRPAFYAWMHVPDPMKETEEAQC